MNFLCLRNEIRRDIVSRLKRIEGQASGILRMIEKDSDCSDILTQISALSAAGRSAGAVIVRGCMEECASLVLTRENKDEIEKKIGDMAEAISRFIAIR